MVKNHSDSERGNPLPPLITLLFPVSREEGRFFFFNDALNTFYVRLYGVGHMIKDHSDSERGYLVPPHGLLFPISREGHFMCHPTDRIVRTMTFDTPVVEHWLGRKIVQ